MAKSKEHKLDHGWRRISESKCAEQGCEFFGKRAQQGVCFSRLDGPSEKYVDLVRKYAEARLAEEKALRKMNKVDSSAKWIKYLESNLECCWMNERFVLDELIRLRAQVGKLGNELGKRK
jgi:hypothetical protein